MQPLKNCIGPAISIGREILCLPYAGFFSFFNFSFFFFQSLSVEGLLSTGPTLSSFCKQ